LAHAARVTSCFQTRKKSPKYIYYTNPGAHLVAFGSILACVRGRRGWAPPPPLSDSDPTPKTLHPAHVRTWPHPSTRSNTLLLAGWTFSRAHATNTERDVTLSSLFTGACSTRKMRIKNFTNTTRIFELGN
jgi:hypothetical protein